MQKNRKYSVDEKIYAVEAYISGEKSISEIILELDMPKNSNKTIRKWIAKYENYGEVAFVHGEKNKSYTKEFKEEMVNRYISGEGSYFELANKYNISSHSTLIKWVLDYNNHIELTNYVPRGDVYTMKSRKTTQEERKEIVKYCLENEKQYNLTAEKYNVPYSSVYQWTNKYIKSGEKGLEDRRGHHKKDEDLDEVELLNKKIARLERELELKDIEVLLLKKVKEIERRRYSPKENKNQNT